MKCVVYARVSTDKQADKELSIPAQLQAMREFARAREWDVVKEYVEPGASARTTDRPVLRELLADLRSGDLKIGTLLVHKIDRLARNVYDHATIRALLRQQGARLASVVENVDASVSGELVENIMASVAQFYSANLSEEVKKGMRQKVGRGGWPHRPPRGYIIIRTDADAAGTIEIHPKDGPLMKRAFELYSSGWYSIHALTERLHREGLVGGTGGPISPAHLRRLLENPFYAGFVHWHNERHQGSHPPLVPMELFERVQAVVEERVTSPAAKGSIEAFPLRRLATCAICRGRMTSERHGRWNYYRCSRQTYRRDACRARFCNADRIHAGLRDICRQVRIEKPLAIDIQMHAQRIIEAKFSAPPLANSLVPLHSAAASAESRLTQAFLGGDLTSDRYRAEVAALRPAASAKRDSVLQQPTPAELADRVIRTIQIATTLWDLYESFTGVRRNSLLKSAFDAVVIDHNGIVGYSLKPAISRLLEQAVDGTSAAEIAGDLVEAA